MWRGARTKRRALDLAEGESLCVCGFDAMRRVRFLRLDALAVRADDDELQNARVRHVNRRVINFRQHAVAQSEPDFRFERVRRADRRLPRVRPLRVFAGSAGREVVGRGCLRARQVKRSEEDERERKRLDGCFDFHDGLYLTPLDLQHRGRRDTEGTEA